MKKLLSFIQNKIEQFIFYLTQPKLYKYFASYFRMKFVTNDIPPLLKNEPYLPWYTYNSIIWLKKYLKPKMNVFEFGSGNSTLFYINNFINIYSVEHNPQWYKKIIDTLTREKKFRKHIKNIVLITPKPYTNNIHANQQNKIIDNEPLDYSKYSSYINIFPDYYFDLIIIDGRSRNNCVNKAIKKVKKGGYLLFDNSEAHIYSHSIKKLNKYSKIDFIGRGPYINTIWKTSVWKIE